MLVFDAARAGCWCSPSRRQSRLVLPMLRVPVLWARVRVALVVVSALVVCRVG